MKCQGDSYTLHPTKKRKQVMFKIQNFASTQTFTNHNMHNIRVIFIPIAPHEAKIHWNHCDERPSDEAQAE